MDTIEILKLVGQSFGYILSGIALITMIVKGIHKKVGGFVRSEARSDDYDERLKRIEGMLEKQANEDDDFRKNILKMLMYLAHASKQSLAFIIESTYQQHKFDKQITALELKRITNAYPVYHDELDGNSYISEIYEEMTKEWEHI